MSEARVCRFCQEAPDGDRYGFVDARRTRCNKVPCVIAWQQEYDAQLRADRARRRMQAAMKREENRRSRRQRKFRRAA